MFFDNIEIKGFLLSSLIKTSSCLKARGSFKEDSKNLALRQEEVLRKIVRILP